MSFTPKKPISDNEKSSMPKFLGGTKQAPVIGKAAPITVKAEHKAPVKAPAAKTGFAPAPNPKADKKPVEKAAKIKAPKEDNNGAVKITVLNKENPHKPDSKRAKAFSHMLKSKTVADYLAGGSHCKFKYLTKWAKDKHITLA